MTEILRQILELAVVLPGLLLAYFPVKSYMRQPPIKLAAWLAPLILALCVIGGVLCYHFHVSTVPALALVAAAAAILYINTLRISLWKSGTIALSVCAVFACMNSLSRAFNAAILMHTQTPQTTDLWFCLWAGVFYNAVCFLAAAAAYYPATHAVRTIVEDENFAQTWYVFWVLPLVFIALNVFMVPRYQTTLYTGRVLQGYFVLA